MQQNVLKLLFTQSKNEAQVRQQTSFLLSCLRQQTRHQLLGLIWRNNSQIVPKNGLLICTSNLQVHCHYLQVKFTNDFASDYKCI